MPKQRTKLAVDLASTLAFHASVHAEIIEKIEQAQIGTAHMGYGELLEWIKGKLKGSLA